MTHEDQADSTDGTGQLLWCTPKAKQLLSELFPANADEGTALPPNVVRQLTGLRQGGLAGARSIIEVASSSRTPRSASM